MTGAAPSEPRIGFSDVLRHRAFLVPYLAEAQSIAGDQLGRVALSVLVFERTNSAAATALTYAATFLPAVIGGWLLGSLGDRFPRRVVMVGCDLLRAAIFAAMAIPGTPLPAVVALLVVAVLLGPAFTSAEVAYLADALDNEHLRVGTGLRLVTSQIAQVAGFAVGGAAVAFLHVSGALLVDAASFAVSALVLGAALPTLRSAAHRTPEPPRSAAPTRSVAYRASSPWRDGQVRYLLALSWLAAFFVVPEGLAVPVAHAAGGGSTQVGLLLAAIPLGGAVGAVLLVRFVPPRRRRSLIALMAVSAGLPLLLTPWLPDWRLVVLAWALSGGLAAYQVEVVPLILSATPVDERSQVVGRFGALLLTAQGVGLLVFGAVAGAIGSATSVMVAGACGIGLGLALVLSKGRTPVVPALPSAPGADVSVR